MADKLEDMLKKVEQAKQTLSNDPEKFKEIFKALDEDIAQIKDDKDLMGAKEVVNVNIEFEGIQLLRLKHLRMIYGTVFGLTNEEVMFYLVNNGIFLKIYELGLLRQKLLGLMGQEVESENDLSIDVPDGGENAQS